MSVGYHNRNCYSWFEDGWECFARCCTFLSTFSHWIFDHHQFRTYYVANMEVSTLIRNYRFKIWKYINSLEWIFYRLIYISVIHKVLLKVLRIVWLWYLKNCLCTLNGMLAKLPIFILKALKANICLKYLLILERNKSLACFSICSLLHSKLSLELSASFQVWVMECSFYWIHGMLVFCYHRSNWNCLFAVCGSPKGCTHHPGSTVCNLLTTVSSKTRKLANTQ